MTTAQDIQDEIDSGEAFVTGITVTAPNGDITRVNPQYCASIRLANLVKEFLSQLRPSREPALEIYLTWGWPLGVNDEGPFIGNAKVPFLLVKDKSGNSTMINPAQEASVFTHGYLVDMAARSLWASVTNALKGL